MVILQQPRVTTHALVQVNSGQLCSDVAKGFATHVFSCCSLKQLWTTDTVGIISSDLKFTIVRIVRRVRLWLRR